jgi:hypothetical protein
MVDCKITAKPGGLHSLVVDGVDISDKVCAVRLEIEAGCIPVLQVCYRCKNVEIDLPECKAEEVELCETYSAT